MPSTSSGLLYRKRIGVVETFYTFDPCGNVCQRFDGSGNLLSTHLFDAYGGMPVGGAPPAPSDPYSGFGGQWGYYTDWETGLQLCGFRYYDASVGRFLTRDPIGYEGGINLYAYADNNPVNAADPLGTSDVLDWIQAGADALGLTPALNVPAEAINLDQAFDPSMARRAEDGRGGGFGGSRGGAVVGTVVSESGSVWRIGGFRQSSGRRGERREPEGAFPSPKVKVRPQQYPQRGFDRRTLLY